MNKEEAQNKINQINILAKELMSYIDDSELKPKAEVEEEESEENGTQWLKLGYSNRIWNTDFDGYQYNMKGEVRRNKKKLKIRKRQFTVSIKGVRKYMYMPSTRSVKVINPDRPTDKALILDSLEDVINTLKLSRYRVNKVVDNEIIIRDEANTPYILRTWFPQPYEMGDNTRKDIPK